MVQIFKFSTFKLVQNLTPYNLTPKKSAILGVALEMDKARLIVCILICARRSIPEVTTHDQRMDQPEWQGMHGV